MSLTNTKLPKDLLFEMSLSTNKGFKSFIINTISSADLKSINIILAAKDLSILYNNIYLKVCKKFNLQPTEIDLLNLSEAHYNTMRFISGLLQHKGNYELFSFNKECYDIVSNPANKVISVKEKAVNNDRAVYEYRFIYIKDIFRSALDEIIRSNSIKQFSNLHETLSYDAKCDKFVLSKNKEIAVSSVKDFDGLIFNNKKMTLLVLSKEKKSDSDVKGLSTCWEFPYQFIDQIRSTYQC